MYFVIWYLKIFTHYRILNHMQFIFQLICMQLCKCINFFLKAHNKQLSQYCLNFTIFLPKKKSFKKNGSGWVRSQVGLGWPAKNMGLVTGQPVFCFGSKKSSSDQVFLGSGQLRKFWPILPCLVPGLIAFFSISIRVLGFIVF